MNKSYEIVDRQKLEDIACEKIPAAITELSAAIATLGARLLDQQTSGSATSPRGDRLLDVHQAAEKLGCSVAHLYHSTTDLPFVVRVGRKLKFSEAGIEKWIRSRSGR